MFPSIPSTNDPFTIAGPSGYVPGLLGSELAFELVDEIIDRTAIESLPALTPLVEVEDGQPAARRKETSRPAS